MKYRIIRSNRRTLSLEINESCEVIVRAPNRFPLKNIESFVNEKSEWIEEKSAVMKERSSRKKNYSDEEIAQLRKKAEQILPEKLEYWSRVTGFIPSGVKVTSAKKRFGSCSPKNSLCFSLYLFDYPDEAVDYVIVHELCHIKEHNHSLKFWTLVKKFMPDYKQRENLLKRF